MVAAVDDVQCCTSSAPPTISIYSPSSALAEKECDSETSLLTQNRLGIWNVAKVIRIVWHLAMLVRAQHTQLFL